MVLRLWLDDVRPAPNGWVHITPDILSMFYHLARHADEISFDHDLGLDPFGNEYPNGYQILTKLEELSCKQEDYIWPLGAPIMTVHSANPVGAQKMEVVIKNIYTLCGLKKEK